VSFSGPWPVLALEMAEHRPMTSMAIKKAEFVRLKAAPIAKLDSKGIYKS
jgi:hypothetical protein